MPGEDWPASAATPAAHRTRTCSGMPCAERQCVGLRKASQSRLHRTPVSVTGSLLELLRGPRTGRRGRVWPPVLGDAPEGMDIPVGVRAPCHVVPLARREPSTPCSAEGRPRPRNVGVKPQAPSRSVVSRTPQTWGAGAPARHGREPLSRRKLVGLALTVTPPTSPAHPAGSVVCGGSGTAAACRQSFSLWL